MIHVAGVPGAGRLKEKHSDFLRCDRSMLDPAGNHQEVSLHQVDAAVTELHPEGAVEHQEELIFLLVVVPHELAPELHQLHGLPVELGDNLRTPVLVNRSQLFAKTDLER
jgi:hypothetical protein